MQTVYAYRDAGPMLALSRWKPRRVFCTERADHSDEARTEYVVKFRQGRAGTAALVSEIVCGELLEAGQIPTLERRLVEVSPQFAVSCRSKQEIPYTVEQGLHFGTVLLRDAESGPPNRIESLQDPQEIVDLWVFDSWICNVDRNTEGNTLLRLGAGGRFRVVACDQSDCFGGATCLSDGTWKRVLKTRGAAESVEFLDRAIMNCGGAEALEAGLNKVHRARQSLDAALSAVPEAWWKASGISHTQLRDALDQRQRRLSQILDVKRWEGLDHDTKGGLLL